MSSSVCSCGNCNRSVTLVLLNLLFSSSVKHCLSVLHGTSHNTCVIHGGRVFKNVSIIWLNREKLDIFFSNQFGLNLP